MVVLHNKEKHCSHTAVFFFVWPCLGLTHYFAMDTVFVILAAALAGFIDASVGGGGLVLVPALFAAYPNVLPATLLGTNKSASVWGTLFAAWHFQRQIDLQWRALRMGVICALLGALAGAYSMTLLSPQLLRQALPALLLAVLLYTLRHKHLGHDHAPRLHGRSQVLAMGVCGGVMGFYDGFFGPGTGSLLVFLLVRWLGFDFLQASAHSKVLNLSSNMAALMLLVPYVACAGLQPQPLPEVSAPEGGEYFSLVLAKDSPMTACVNKAIASMRDDGTLEAITKEWLADKVNAPEFTP